MGDELVKYLFQISIGGLTAGGIIIYLGKIIIGKSSEVFLETQKNKIEIHKIEHQVKYSKLHEERGTIIKELYVSLFNLESMLSLIAVQNELDKWQSKDITPEKMAAKKYQETREFLEKNRLYLKHELCEKIINSLNDCLALTSKMITAKTSENKNISSDESIVKQWRFEEIKSAQKIKEQRLELAEVFREIIGVK
ncbi:hypothetical protein [Flavobacterium laiguense]|uniref:Uncharacterized protein n=1 Tax=Flavobacterium laiguense TaxID=2169409 RepID=A0A2U1K2D7_9FLAO|nr:hypothetical protein [Flavobacterium laiguense]PWA11676.1 hypothetical protein DB891_02405 [Flavobacterium laiguense]